MKIFVWSALMLVAIQFLDAQTNTSTTKKTTFSVAVDENTVIKDGSGNRVAYKEAMSQLASGRYTLDPVRDSKGFLLHFQIRMKIESDSSRRETEFRQLQASKGNEFISPGTFVRDFKLKTLKGKELTLQSLAGKVIVFNFWFSVCKPCQTEIPELNELAESFKDSADVVFIAVDWEKSDAVAQYTTNNQFKYQVCAEASAFIDAMGIKFYPTHLVVDRTGVIFSSYTGGIQGISSTLREDILDALAN